MQNVSLELSLLSIFSLVSFFTFLLIQKFSNHIFSGALLDDDFVKPQSFHESEIPRSGGLASIISLMFFIFLNKSILIFLLRIFNSWAGNISDRFSWRLKNKFKPKNKINFNEYISFFLY